MWDFIIFFPSKTKLLTTAATKSYSPFRELKSSNNKIRHHWAQCRAKWFVSVALKSQSPGVPVYWSVTAEWYDTTLKSSYNIVDTGMFWHTGSSIDLNITNCWVIWRFSFWQQFDLSRGCVSYVTHIVTVVLGNRNRVHSNRGALFVISWN